MSLKHNYVLGKNSEVVAKELNIHDKVVIGSDCRIKCEKITIGKNSQIGNNVKISCKTLEIGDGLYMADGVEIGRGGSQGPNSHVKIGNYVGIFENTIINPSEKVTIGDNVGIGGEVMIWTHGAWLDVMQGFPADFGPVTIGNDVWLPARCIVLPNVEIGDNCVIGIGSTLNKSIPEGSLAAGSPCKVLKENYYPKKLTNSEKYNILYSIVQDYTELISMKKVPSFGISLTHNTITMIRDYELDEKKKRTVFDIDKRIIEGYECKISEDLRDYLRRRGVKIHTTRMFQSL